MAGITLRITGITREIERLGAMAARAADLGPALRRWGIYHVQKTRRIIRGGERGVRTLHSGSGLEASLTFRVEGSTWAEGSNKVYAGVQQRGGTIESSRPGGFLAIPVADNLGARDPKFDSPRDVPDGFFIRTDADQLLFVSKKDKGPKPRRGKTRIKGPAVAAFKGQALLNVWFRLVKRVTLKATKYCSFDAPDAEAWQRMARSWIVRGR